MVTSPTILLDIDGVCANLAKGAIQLHGLDYASTMRDWPKGTYQFHTALKMTSQEFWQKLNDVGADFWENLEHYEWFDKLYTELNLRGNVVFCSSPSLDPFCMTGKMKWLQNRMGVKFRNYVFTNQKHLLAKNTTILVDDSEIMCDKFHKHGGNVVLFPQLWNRNFPYANRAYEKAIYTVDQYLERIATHA